MMNRIRMTCLAVGAGLAFASVANAEKAAPAASAGVAATVRPGTVVEIKPNRIYLIWTSRRPETGSSRSASAASS